MLLLAGVDTAKYLGCFQSGSNYFWIIGRSVCCAALCLCFSIADACKAKSCASHLFSNATTQMMSSPPCRWLLLHNNNRQVSVCVWATWAQDIRDIHGKPAFKDAHKPCCTNTQLPVRVTFTELLNAGSASANDLSFAIEVR